MSTYQKNNEMTGWLNGWISDKSSLNFKEFFIPIFFLSNKPDNSQKTKAGELKHGSKIQILESKYNPSNKQKYLKVKHGEIEGWISENFISTKWSLFSFFGNFLPEKICQELHTSIEIGGITMEIFKNDYMLSTCGNPKDFDQIRAAVETLLRRITNSQIWSSKTPLSFELMKWIEIEYKEDTKIDVIGFYKNIDNIYKNNISNSDFYNSRRLVPLMSLIPYFDLAINDFYQARVNPQHALIFLSRVIESIENYFKDTIPKNENITKEKYMQKLLNVEKNVVEYVMHRANDSHRRHATKNGKVQILPNEELEKCFSYTKQILDAFYIFLSKK